MLHKQVKTTNSFAGGEDERLKAGVCYGSLEGPFAEVTREVKKRVLVCQISGKDETRSIGDRTG